MLILFHQKYVHSKGEHTRYVHYILFHQKYVHSKGEHMRYVRYILFHYPLGSLISYRLWPRPTWNATITVDITNVSKKGEYVSSVLVASCFGFHKLLRNEGRKFQQLHHIHFKNYGVCSQFISKLYQCIIAFPRFDFCHNCESAIEAQKYLTRIGSLLQVR